MIEVYIEGFRAHRRAFSPFWIGGEGRPRVKNG